MKKTLLLIVFTTLIQGISVGQNNLTLYNMEVLPQNLLPNPAKTPDCKWYIGMPAVSSIDFQFASNALAFKSINDAIVERSGGDGYSFQLGKFAQTLDEETFVNLGVNAELLNFGFRLRKSMFTFGITEKVKTRISIPNDILKLGAQGNGGNNLGYDFNFNFGFDVIHTREFALGYSRQFLNDKLTVGARMKYIRGLNVLSTDKNDLKFRTDENNFAYNVTADVELNASSPGLSLIDGVEVDPLAVGLGSRKNSGFGIDLGAEFDLTKRISVSASVVDLGLISWNEDVQNLKSENPGAIFQFRGIDLNDYIGDSSQGFEVLLDTLADVFRLDSSNNGFNTTLFSEFYLGGNFRLTDRHQAGVLFYGSFYNKQLYPALTLSWNSKLTRFFAISVSYSMMHGNFQNLGLGFVTNLGPEQFYIVSDHAIGAATSNVKNLGGRFGWNHVFGRKKYEKEQRVKRGK